MNRSKLALPTTRENLTKRQEAFVREYMIDLNATQAAIRAGYSPRCANVQGSQNLVIPNVKNAVRLEIEKRESEKAALAVATREELRRQGFSDIRDVIEWSSKGVVVKDSKKLGEKSRAVQEVTVSRGFVKVKMYDKVAALDKLARHLGMYEDAEAGKGSVQIAIVLNGKDADL